MMSHKVIVRQKSVGGRLLIATSSRGLEIKKHPWIRNPLAELKSAGEKTPLYPERDSVLVEDASQGDDRNTILQDGDLCMGELKTGPDMLVPSLPMTPQERTV
jgi:hypothetical protein